jgi:hypothetical protein
MLTFNTKGKLSKHLACLNEFKTFYLKIQISLGFGHIFCKCTLVRMLFCEFKTGIVDLLACAL